MNKLTRRVPSTLGPLVGLLVGALLLGLACSDDGRPDMESPKETVSDGTTNLLGTVSIAVQAGSGVFGLGEGMVSDGWTVKYTKVLATIGDLQITQADGFLVSRQLSQVIDLQALPAGALVTSVDLEPGVVSVEFTLPNANARFSPAPGSASDDVDFMAKQNYSLYVEGTIEKVDGQSCAPGDPTDCVPATSITFAWGLLAGQRLSDCSDFDITSNNVIDQTIVLHADRWFLTNFGAFDPAPQRRAQWIADADLDRNGNTTLDELLMIKAELLFTPELYDLADAPVPVDSAYDFLDAQARTLGRDSFTLCRTSTPELTPG